MPRQLFVLTDFKYRIHSAISLDRILFSLFILILVFTGKISAQNIVYDQYDIIDSYDSKCVEQHINFFPSIECAEEIEGRLNVLPVRFNYTFNDGFARSYNDGPTWQGRGSNLNIGLGFSGSFGRFRYVLNPIVHFRENKGFDIGADLTTRPPFQYPFDNNIDYVVRYGDDSAFKIFPGQSEISYNFKPISFALSTQNMRWGPAIYNPIIMSTNAAGIPHLRIGSNQPWETGIGRIEAQLMWGFLKESEYFNDISEDDERYFSGMTIGYQPSFFEKLSIGFNRIFHAQTQYLSEPFRDAFVPFTQFFTQGEVREVNGRELNDAYDQILSLTFLYNDKEADFKAYFEWARGDFAGSLTNLVQQPEHNSGYTAGIVKSTPFLFDLDLRFIYEHSSLATWETSFVRAGTSFYTHQLNEQGLTNNGQIIGAGIGPGSQADYVNISLSKGRSSLSGEYQRIRFNDDYFFTTFTQRISGKPPHDLEHQFGLIYKTERDRIDLRAGVFQSLRYSYLYREGIPGSRIFNTSLNLTIKYKF